MANQSEHPLKKTDSDQSNNKEPKFDKSREILIKGPLTNRVRGTVKWISQEKGYGFIRLDDPPIDIFVSESSIQGGIKNLYQGLRVELTVLEATPESRTVENEAFLQYEIEQSLERQKEMVLIPDEDQFDSTMQRLTPEYLRDVISPFIIAVAEVQHISDELKKNKANNVIITSIRHKSPISVSLDGASDAIQLIKDTVVPWRRKHVETIALLVEREKLADIENKNAEVMEKRARAAKDRAESEKMIAEAAKQRQEAERIKLENEKLRLELKEAKIQLGMNVINQIAPHLTGMERIRYLIELLPILDTLVNSTIAIEVKE